MAKVNLKFGKITPFGGFFTLEGYFLVTWVLLSTMCWDCAAPHSDISIVRFSDFFRVFTYVAVTRITIISARPKKKAYLRDL